MFSSISPKAAAGKSLTSPYSLSQAKKAPVKSIPVFGDEIAAPAAAQRNAKIAPRQNSVSAKTSTVAAAAAAAKSQKLVAKSLTNKSIATNPIVKSATSAPLVAKTAATKATIVKPKEDAVTTPPVDPAEAVRAILTELGYEPGSFKFETHEEYVMFPGGGYTHKFTSVELPNGLKENFTTDLMARYPAVTANELRRLMENQHLTTEVTVQNFGGGVS